MSASRAPTVDAETWVKDWPISDTLLTAPPGCGKTEYLARRAGALIRRGEVSGPRQILALTFSNKAKANLRTRLEKELGPDYWHHVAVLNFHGLGLRLLRHHAPLAGRRGEDLLGPQRGSLRALRRQVCEQHQISADDLDQILRHAKSGAFTDAEVLDRLQASPAGLAYELALRQNGRIDHDDAIRLGVLIARHPSIEALYRNRFACVLVDEVQDLSLPQFELVAGLGLGRTVFAGDRAQGIYGFAGAAPTAVYEAIEARADATVTLDASYRSAPNIVTVVSAISVGLGGTTLTAAADASWTTNGDVVIERFSDPQTEAARVIEVAAQWLGADPLESVAVMVRAKHRRETLDAAVRDAGLVAEIWDFPAHRPGVVALLSRFLSGAVRAAGDGGDGVEELFLRCAEALTDQDEAMLDELSEAADALRDLVETTPLSEVVAGIRVASDPDAPARPGLHLLNGHVGKGQQFDRVVVLGLEDGHIPYYKAKTDEAVKDELSVLHVMASRARRSLVFTVCRDVPRNGSSWIRKPSRWLKSLEKYATGWVP